MIVGSSTDLYALCRVNLFKTTSGSRDVVLLPTAAAYGDPAGQAIALSEHFDADECRVEALMVLDAASANDPYFAQRVRDCDLAVLGDGAALHLRSVLRHSLLLDALRECRALVGIGAAATALGATMIDPRGGAPTTGLGLFDEFVVTTLTSEAQLERTKELLGEHELLAVLGGDGALARSDQRWRVVSETGVTWWRGRSPATLD